MFESLSDKLTAVFSKLSGKGRLSENDVDEALREVRLALLEADVNFKVAKSFIGKVRERAVGNAVLESLTPAQQVIKIVNEELIAILGGGQHKLGHANTPPTVILLVGLQGAGKTTTASKLALHLRRSGQKPLLVAADPYRPAAITQLITLGKQLDLPVYSDDKTKEVRAICTQAMKRAREIDATTVILDTAGRLHIDEELMDELAQIKASLHPTEVLLIADAMTGQEAVKIADEFNTRVGLTGVILTKMDGDARGGAALSLTQSPGCQSNSLVSGRNLMPWNLSIRIACRPVFWGWVTSLVSSKKQRPLSIRKKRWSWKRKCAKHSSILRISWNSCSR